MKSIAVLLLALTASIRAVTPEEVIAKHDLENPSYDLQELALSPCSIVVESTVYFYRGNTDTVDSTVGWWSRLTEKGSMRKTVFEYRRLGSGFSEKVATHFIVEGPETLSVTRYLYNRQGLLIREEATSKTLRSTTIEFTYDLQGRLVRSHGKGHSGKSMWDHRYFLDGHGRAICRKDVNQERWVDSLRYDDNDSLIAELRSHGREPLYPHYLWFRDSVGRETKRTEYMWKTHGLPCGVYYSQYGRHGLLSRQVAFTDFTLGKYEGATSLQLNSYTTFEYDTLGRLRRRIQRRRPFDD
jgi:YD repeat-containing protein